MQSWKHHNLPYGAGCLTPYFSKFLHCFPSKLKHVDYTTTLIFTICKFFREKLKNPSSSTWSLDNMSITWKFQISARLFFQLRPLS
jgi:hypothetical protein